jgi:hypothetical protein
VSGIARSGVDIFGNTGPLWDRNSIGPKAFDMEADRLANLNLDRRDRVAGSDAAGQVRHTGRIIAVGFFDHDCVAINADPSGRTATITRRGRTGCLYCR